MIASDVSSIRTATRAAYSKWVPTIGREPRPMKTDYEAAIREHLIDLYLDCGEVVGLIELIPQIGYLLIENVAVVPDSQGKGIGDSLLGHTEAFDHSSRNRELRLYTNVELIQNISYYTKRGDEELERGPIATGGIAGCFMPKASRC